MSSEFWLYPPGVTHQAGVWSEWSVMAGNAKTWVSDHPLENVADHELYARGATTAIDIRTGLIEWLGHLESVLAGVATELCSVADEGETIDLEQQAELDLVDPETYVGYDQTYYGTGGLVAADDRVEENLPIFPPPNGAGGTYWDMGSAYFDNIDISSGMIPGDLLSPSEWVWTVLGWLGAQDISELVLSAFGGPWGDLYEFQNTLAGLYTMVDEMRGSLGSSVGYLGVLWQGFAATSAQKYFTEFLAALDTAKTVLSDASQAFADYLTGMVQQAEAIEGLINTMTDAVIIAAAAAALGAGTWWSGVGGVVGFGSSGISLAVAAKAVWDIRGKLQELELLYDILVSLENSYTTLSDFTTSMPVPTLEDAP